MCLRIISVRMARIIQRGARVRLGVHEARWGRRVVSRGCERVGVGVGVGMGVGVGV